MNIDDLLDDEPDGQPLPEGFTVDPLEVVRRTEKGPFIPVIKGRCCFPVTKDGMPRALESLPAGERSAYWRNFRYRKMHIAQVPVQDPRHAYLFEQTHAGRKVDRAFYVRSPQGTVGLVPFPTSTVVWPWELGWTQDLAPENQGKARRVPGEHFGPDPKDSQRKEYK